MKQKQKLTMLFATLAFVSPLFAGKPASAISLLGPKKKVVKQSIPVKEAGNGEVELIRRAKKAALEKLVHESVAELETAESFRGVKAKQTVFVRDALALVDRNVDRFVRQARVVRSSKEGDLLEAEIEVAIDGPAFMRELSILDRRLAEAGFPKVMFLVEEDYRGRDGKTSAVPEPTLRTVLESGLLARGFDVVAKEQVDKLRREEGELFRKMLGEGSDAAVQYAVGRGADILVVAAAHIVHTSYDTLKMKEHHANAEVSLRAIQVSSGELIESSKTSKQSPPNCFDEKTLQVESVMVAAPELVEPFVDRLILAWDKAAERGARYVVRLYNVKSKKRQGTAFMAALGKVPGIRLVKETAFVEGRLEVEVFFASDKTVTHLEQEIFKAASKFSDLRSLDVDSSRAREINLRL